MVVDGSTVWIFGGFEDGSRSNKIRTFDLEQHKWSLVEPADPRAPLPKERAGHSAVLYENSIYIFGGKDDENFKLNDLWKFDLAARTWTNLETATGTAPMARAGHTANVYEGKMFIFGGIFEVTKELNDCHIYDIVNDRWICVFEEKNEDGTSAQSPTKIMSMGNNSPGLRKQTTLAGKESPKADKSVMKNGMPQQQPKKIKLPSEESKHPKKDVKLDSPTSTDMQRSLLIANADPSFDFMAHLKKKKNNFGTFGGATHNSFGLNMTLS